MSTEYFQRISSEPEEALSYEERAARQLEEHTDLLTHGKLLKHLRKKHKVPEVAYQKFARISAEIAEIETGLHEHGVLTEARWRFKKTKESGARVIAGLVIGLLAALIPSGEEIKIEYSTLHRIDHSTIRWYFWRKILLTFLYVLAVAAAMISIMWLFICLAIAFDHSSSQEERMWVIVPIIITPLCFIAAAKIKKSIIPPLLRIYGGNHFELVSLKPLAEPPAMPGR